HTSTTSAAHHRALPSFPTRRSSDLWAHSAVQSGAPQSHGAFLRRIQPQLCAIDPQREPVGARRDEERQTSLPAIGGNTMAALPTDRKSTRLNSSHDQISYAVFCLKK